MEAQCLVFDQQQAEMTGRELIERMAQQDQLALQEFYDRYNKLVFSFVLKVLSCRNEAEEVVLEVFWQVWQQSNQYNQTRGTISAWLVMMARSRAIDRRRARERAGNILYIVDNSEFQDTHQDSGLDPEEQFYNLEQREAVLSALAEMGDKQRKAIELAYFSGLSQSEIATQLQEPLGTIKTRIRAGVQILRERLKRFIEP